MPVAPASARRAPPAWIALPIALAALLWSARTPVLGVPVADDYAFLAWRRFHGLHLFDSMGASFYWRPVSRQLWYSLVGPLLLRTPWGPWAVAALHALLLLAIAALLYRIARRVLPPWPAAAVAVFPLLSEPARTLLDWPSGSQHLLAMLCALLAVHAALARRPWIAGAALLAGAASHESALLALPVLLALALWRPAPRAERLALAAAALAALALWGAGYARALGVGVQMPAGAHAPTLARLPRALGMTLAAQLGGEDLEAGQRALLAALAVLVFAVAAALAFRPAARARLRHAWPSLAAGVGWFVLGVAPLAPLLPDWNAWRTAVPALGLGFATTAALALCSPWLAGAWVVLRAVALLASPAAPVNVVDVPPATVSDLSFVHLVRLQRIVASSRAAVTAQWPALPRGTTVSFWHAPRMAMVGFDGPWAARTWYADSTLQFVAFGGRAGLERPENILLEFQLGTPWPGIVVPPPAVRLYKDGLLSMLQNRLPHADSVLTAATELPGVTMGAFLGSVELNRARIAASLGQTARAESLVRVSVANTEPTADYYVVEAYLAAQRGQLDTARGLLAIGLKIEPGNADGLRLAQLLAARTPPAAAAPAPATATPPGR